MSHDTRRTVSMTAAGCLLTASLALAQGAAPPASTPSPQAQPWRQDARRPWQQPPMPPSAEGRAEDAPALSRDYQVPIDSPQGSGDTTGSDIQVPIGKTPPQPAPLPPNVGYNNSGGMVDGAALEAQANQGVHYHYHYYGAGAFTTSGMPGYATPRYVSPAAAAPGGGGGWMTPPVGPGNPAPMNTLAGEYQNSVNPAVWRGPAPNPELAGGGMGGDVGGQAWGYGSQVGDWNPFALGGNGYISGFND
jgi:hypothetical protein